jgi:hypothetical protein
MSGTPLRVDERKGLMRTFTGMLAGLALLAAVTATAKENYKEKAFNADTRDKFEQVSAKVREEMREGGRYQYVKPSERSTIEQKLSEMESLFKQSDTVQGMNEQTKIALFNDQEVVNSILTQRDADRVICKREAPIGSHIPVTTCHTYGQEQDARKNSNKMMDTWSRTPCGDVNKGACGGGG